MDMTFCNFATNIGKVSKFPNIFVDFFAKRDLFPPRK